MIFLGGNPGGAGSLAFFLDFGLLQKADNRQAPQPSPAATNFITMLSLAWQIDRSA
jgi:hypothetical protein